MDKLYLFHSVISFLGIQALFELYQYSIIIIKFIDYSLKIKYFLLNSIIFKLFDKNE